MWSVSADGSLMDVLVLDRRVSKTHAFLWDEDCSMELYIL